MYHMVNKSNCIFFSQKTETNGSLFMINFKQLVTGGLVALSLQLVALTAQAMEKTTRIAEDVYSFTAGMGYTSMFVVTTDGVVAVESINTKHATAFLKAITEVTDQPVKYLIQTHNHWDHTGGGQVFRDAGAKIVAHQEAIEWMRANQGRDVVIPDQSWDAKRKDITLGGMTIELHYLGMSHGQGMSVIRVAQQKVIYIADVVTPDRVMFTIGPDFHINELKRALSEIEALSFDTAIFSHPDNDTAIGDKSDVVKGREYIEDLQGAIVAEFKKGTNFYKIPGIIKLPKYKDWKMYEEWLPMNTWRVMLDMYMGPFTWRPAKEYEK